MIRKSEDIEQFIQESSAALEEIKTKQQVGGHNILFYQTSSEETYDAHIFSNAEFKSSLVRFTTAKPRFQLVYLSMFSRLSPNVMAGPIAPAAPAPLISTTYRVLPFQRDYVDFEIWVDNHTYEGAFPSNYDVYFKFFFQGTATGTWTVTPLT